MCRSHKGDECAKCNCCRIDISVARGGKNDVTKRFTSENHKKEHYIGKKKSKDNHLYGKSTKREDQRIYADKNLQCS